MGEAHKGNTVEDSLSKDMNLFKNNVAQLIGANNRTASNDEIAQLVLKAL